MSTSLILRIGADISALNARLKQAESRLKRFAFKAERVGSDLTTRVSLPIIGIGAAAVKAFAEFDRIEKGLAALGGTTKAGADQFQRLNRIVLDTRTTLDLRTAALGAQRLQGAGLSAAFAERTIKQLGIAATVSGSAIDDVGGVLRQFTQIIGKGKIEQEDLNSILDRMPALGAVIKKEFGGVTAEAIRNTGISMEEFVSRTVSAIEANESFQNVQGGLAKSFESFANAVVVGIAPLGKAIANALNLEENLQRLGDAITNASQKFSELGVGTQRFIVLSVAAVAAVGPLSLALGAVARSLPLLRSGFGFILGPLTSLGTAAIFTGKALSGYANLLVTGVIPRNAAFIKSAKALRAAMALATGPLGLIVGAIVLVGASLKTAYDNSEFFRNQLTRLARAFDPIVNVVRELAGKVLGALGVSLSEVGSVFNGVFGVIAGVISFVIEGFIQLVDTVILVTKAIRQVGELDFSGAADSLSKTLFNPSVFVDNAKNAVEAAFTVFDDTISGEPLSLNFGGSGVSDASGGDGTELVGGGTGRSVEVVQQLSTSISDLIGNYERANIAALAVAGTNQRLADEAGRFAVTLSAGPLQAYSDGLQVIAEKAAVFGDSFDTVGAKISATQSNLNNLLENGFNQYSSEVIFLQEQLALLTEEQIKQLEVTRANEATTRLWGQALNTIGLDIETLGEKFKGFEAVLVVAGATLAKTIETAFDGMAKSGESFGRSLAKATKSIVNSFIKQGVAAAISNTLTKLGLAGPLVLPIAAVAGAGASALFSSLLGKIPALAEGGIATGATLALIGEGRESEAILPLSKLQNLLDMNGGGGGGQVQFRISGEDLVAVYDQGRARQNRIF